MTNVVNFLKYLYSNPKKTAISIVIFLVFIYALFIKPPNDFPTGYVVKIEEGTSLTQTANLLERENIIQSSFAFSTLFRIFGGDSKVLSGSYSFKKPLSLFSVWSRVSRGETGEELIRVTIPEGATVREIGEIFSEQVPDFDKELFYKLAKDKEGYLFPETYVVSPGINPETIIGLMEDTFYQKVGTLSEEIDSFGMPLDSVITMASLLEREARLYETKQKVAGILWKRIEIGMPLQVDAVFGYIFGIDTYSPTFEDLEVDSPYNTYKNLGLPPGAISNPGLESIKAAINPISSKYLYYLTGADGVMHYSSTFEQHVANRRFLR